MQNIEVKVRLLDRAAAETRLREIGARPQWSRRQKDTFFEVPRGWLKLRESEGRHPELISYVRPTDVGGPRTSEYDVAIVEDAALWLRLLGRVLPVGCVVCKERTLWLHAHTRVHLDRVDGLGDYLELETVVRGISREQATRESEQMIRNLELDPQSFVAVPYRDLLTAGRRVS